jgi:hypothetical protein
MKYYVLWIMLAGGQQQARTPAELQSYDTKAACMAAGWGWLAEHKVTGTVTCRVTKA